MISDRTAMLAAVGVWVFLLTFLSMGPVSAGWVWDGLQAIGFGALVVGMWLALESGTGRGAAVHEWLAWLVIVLSGVHAVGLLIYDPTVLEYLKPGAPWGMWSGVLALVVLLALIATARPGLRRRLFADRRRFADVHKVAAWLLLVLMWVHVSGSGFYVSSLAVLILVASSAGALLFGTQAASMSKGAALSTLALCSAFFVGLRWLVNG